VRAFFSEHVQPLRWTLTLLLVFCAVCRPASGQQALRQVNPQTQVSRVDFKGNSIFSDDQLQEQIATNAPSFLSRLQFWKESSFPLRPIELQKDVVRLRNFYERRGFLHPSIDYIVEHDPDDNTAHIVFTILPGPPLLIEDITLVGPEGDRPASEQFPGEQQSRWMNACDRVQQRIGGRFQTTDLTAVRSELLTWSQNEGYAFPEVTSDTAVTHSHPPGAPGADPDHVDINLQVDAGPRGTISEIVISGNRSVSRQVILNAIPLRVGDQFSQQALSTSQRQLFSLNLFRMALVDLPDQPRDSTVTVRIRIQEADPRYLSAQTGYSLTRGIDVEGQWQHRNFLGSARSLIVSSDWSTGLAAVHRSEFVVPSRFRIGASLRQPFLFSPRLSGIIAPFYERRQEQAYALQQYGLNSTLIFNFYRFRTISLQHTFARTAALTSVALPEDRFFNRSVLNVNARFGKANDYLNPTDGFLIQPFVEFSDPQIGSRLQYAKVGLENSFYTMITDNIGIATRLFGGRLWPYGTSADQEDPVIRERFSDIRFYGGGSDDVRGWHNQLLGPKRIDTTATTPRYVPLGGQGKVFANLELRFPMPLLGSSWGLTTFVDAGDISTDGFALDPREYKYGGGAGIRYATPIGPLRFDVAFKLNPSPIDVRPPAPSADPSFWRRMVVYFSIGNPF
jgi:outer membrane protein insertion porin family